MTERVKNGKCIALFTTWHNALVPCVDIYCSKSPVAYDPFFIARPRMAVGTTQYELT